MVPLCDPGVHKNTVGNVASQGPGSVALLWTGAQPLP